jgi:hypothetical protein
MATPNALFAILNVADRADVQQRLESIAPWVYMKVADGEWLLVAPASVTSKEVSESLGFAGSEAKNGLVLRMDNYFGRQPRSTWEWIAAKQGAEHHFGL